ncbi:glucuronyl esterase domain-containing protein [Tellurirhabdus rosea]|uniref:glucuronyl esterase domain-containing protein n=1 Tax=Tellurirhabdus rosea TaxID=2674997 RepID=UPI00224CB0DE|nr:acetylxylan esterase [Tellurirhabdus rosea]
MRFYLASCLLLGFPLSVLAQSGFVPNYDEAKMPAYTLPDVLKTQKGKSVATAGEWERTQRPFLLNQFAEHVYGRTPAQKVAVRYEVKGVDNNALNGQAIRKQIAVHWPEYPDLKPLDILLYIPKGASGPVPVFVGMNFCGNHCVTTEADIPLTERWLSNVKDKVVNNRATEAARGFQVRRWPLTAILKEGYAVATAYYGDIEPDHPEGWREGIRAKLNPPTTNRPDNWGAVGAWAWGYSRMLDYLETDAAVDARRAIAIGHSRIGKAAIWAGAQDPRFAAVISNESGEGGAALARRIYGETIGRINTAFPHWFAPQYKTYNDDPARLPVDQHQLLALIAPRPLYVASAEQDQWADPKGEFLSARQTDAVYALYGKPGVGTDQMPGVNQPVGQYVRYHVRTGVHDVTDFDWQQYVKFGKLLKRPEVVKK